MKKVRFRTIKPEIRIIGIDDGSFEPKNQEETCLAGVISRGGKYVDGVLVDKIKIDGTDSSSTIANMINKSRHKDQLRIVMTSGITFGGFNVLDVNEVFEKTGLPLIVVSRDQPNMESVKNAIKNLPNWRERWKILKSAGDIIPVETKSSEKRKSTIYIQIKGIKKEDAIEVIKMTSTRSSIPEPIRLAHLIATGIARGESIGRR